MALADNAFIYATNDDPDPARKGVNQYVLDYPPGLPGKSELDLLRDGKNSIALLPSLPVHGSGAKSPPDH